MPKERHGLIHSYERDQFWIDTVVLVLVLAFMGQWFFLPIAGSLFFSILLSISFRPLYDKLAGGKKSKLWAMAIATLTLCIPVIPVIVVVYYSAFFVDLILEAMRNVESSQYIFVVDTLDKVKAWSPTLDRYIQNPVDMLSEEGIIGANIGKVTSVTQAIITAIYGGTMKTLFWLVVIWAGVYYQLPTGNLFGRFVRTVLPLRPGLIDDLLHNFVQTSRAMVKVTLIIGFAQGIAGFIVLWLLGTPYAFLWGFLMVVFAMVPVVGAGFVLAPIALFYYGLGLGDYWSMGLVLVALVLIGWADNVIKPIIVGGDSEMEPRWVLLGVVGGLISFGVIGAFLGPVIFALGLAYLYAYSHKYKDRHGAHIDHATEFEVKMLPKWKSFAPQTTVKRNRRK